MCIDNSVARLNLNRLARPPVQFDPVRSMISAVLFLSEADHDRADRKENNWHSNKPMKMCSSISIEKVPTKPRIWPDITVTTYDAWTRMRAVLRGRIRSHLSSRTSKMKQVIFILRLVLNAYLPRKALKSRFQRWESKSTIHIRDEPGQNAARQEVVGRWAASQQGKVAGSAQRRAAPLIWNDGIRPIGDPRPHQCRVLCPKSFCKQNCHPSLSHSAGAPVQRTPWLATPMSPCPKTLNQCDAITFNSHRTTAHITQKKNLESIILTRTQQLTIIDLQKTYRERHQRIHGKDYQRHEHKERKGKESSKSQHWAQYLNSAAPNQAKQDI